MDEVPRAPEYRQGSVIDLTLKVEDLIDQRSGAWNRARVLDAFAPKDAEIILNMKPNLNRSDSVVWGLTKTGIYSSKSGYQLLDTLEVLSSPATVVIPPVEKQLWSALWKTKTTPKLRHFLWRTLSGALAVKERLRSRGILLDTTCSSCNEAPEDIGHVLFHCRFAQKVWALSSVPMPPSGSWSRSIFLNLHHLISCSRKKNLSPDRGLIFPWILWHIWKARNSFCFDHIRFDPAVVLDKARMEAEVWRNLQTGMEGLANPPLARNHRVHGWSKPPDSWVKCNVASSLVVGESYSGGAWLVRDATGSAVYHSRRAFSRPETILVADLMALKWSVEDMISLKVDKMMFETSSGVLRDAFYRSSSLPRVSCLVSEILQSLTRFRAWRMDHVEDASNKVAVRVAQSVTSDRRFQSYVATGGPAWLHHLLIQEAAGNPA